MKAILLFAVVFVCACGCSGGDVTAPADDEITQYLDEHPEAKIDVDPSNYSNEN